MYQLLRQYNVRVGGTERRPRVDQVKLITPQLIVGSYPEDGPLAA